MTTPTPTIKVFQMDDIEWWAGESLAACIKEGQRQCGADCYTEESDQGEVSEEAMHRLKYMDEDGTTRTFAEELARMVAAGTKFPCMFAATDY